MTKSLIYELILALVSLWLLVDSIKKEKPQRKNVRLIFLIILLKDIFWLLYYYFASLILNVVMAWPNGRISF